jgi:hypothetical protein
MFQPIGPRTVTDTPFALIASSNWGLPVSFEAGSANIAINSDKVTPNKSGVALAKAIQNGNENINPVEVSQQFCLNPKQPQITSTGATMTASTIEDHESYVWYHDNTPIMGITSATYKAPMPGTYSVEVSVGDCVSARSNEKTFLVTTAEEDIDELVRVSPNPATEKISITVSERINSITLYTNMGMEITPASIRKESAISCSMNVSNVPEGLYILKLSTNSGIYIKRIVITR